jgi:pyruvate formate lyase activating enzyme
MRVGGLDKFTLSDYPGEVAAIVFTQGCNFRCPFCHNGSLLPMESDALIPEEEVLSFLESRSRQLTGVVITGGEPTLQPDLSLFLQKVRLMGLKIKLDTNGSHPEIVKSLLDKGLLDFIAMDIKAPWRLYDRLTGVKAPKDKIEKSISLIAQSGIRHEFRTTWVRPLLSDDDIEEIKAMVPPGSPHRLQKFRAENALDPTLRTDTVLNSTLQ